MDIKLNYPHLAKPPIVEALIDFQVRFDELPTIEVLRDVTSLIKEEFPSIEERNRARFNFSNPKNSIDKDILGFVARTEDKEYAVQIMKDRFTFSRLAPYTDWDDLCEHTNRIWRIYRETVQPKRIVRLAVRYINQLLLPSPIQDFSLYINNAIEIPDGLPQGLSEYMTRLIIPDPESGAVASVQQNLNGITNDERVSIIFDIDAFKSIDIDTDNEEQIWSNLELLHEYKNRIFFKSLTKEAIGLFQ